MDTKAHLAGKTRVLRGCKFPLSAFERKPGKSVLKFDFFKEGASLRFSDLSTNMGFTGMVEREDYLCMDMVTPFGVAFIDLFMGFVYDASIASVVNSHLELESIDSIKNWNSKYFQCISF